MIEIEAKFILSDRQADIVRSRLLSAEGIAKISKSFETNTMYDTADGRCEAEDARLRVRTKRSDAKVAQDADSTDIEFCHKKRLSVENGIKREEEVECAFRANPLEFAAILSKMGFEPVSGYERWRETYVGNGLKWTLDMFPFGWVLEVEGEEFLIQRALDDFRLRSLTAYALSCDDLYRDLCTQQGMKPRPFITFNDPEMPKMRP